MFQDKTPLIVHISEEDFDFYTTSKILGTDNNKIGHKEQFLIALSLGFKLGHTTELKKPKDFFRSDYLTEEDESIIYAIAINHFKDIKNIESVSDIFTLAEEYANSGIQIVKDLEKNSSYDNYLKKFEKLIKDDIKQIKSSVEE